MMLENHATSLEANFGLYFLMCATEKMHSVSRKKAQAAQIERISMFRWENAPMTYSLLSQRDNDRFFTALTFD